jgi:hypothetical protein
MEFSFYVVLDAAEGGNFVVEDEVRSSGVAIVGEASAAGVDEESGELDAEVTDAGDVGVAVDDDGFFEGRVDDFEIGVGCVGGWGSPAISRLRVDKGEAWALDGKR